MITVLIYFSELLQSDEIFNLKKSMVFWISLGVLLFNIGFIPVDIIAEFISFSGVFRIIALILNNQKKELQELDNQITGFNVGVNIGKDAGQSIMHCHIHLIPRREGDVDNPQGGVRSVIPKKQHYERKI